MGEYNGLLVIDLVDLEDLVELKLLSGINAGDGSRYVTVPQSLTPEIIYIDQTSNVGTPGIWMYQVNTGILHAYCSVVYY